MKNITLFLLFIISTASTAASASIFKCVSGEGKTYYADKPCTVEDQETQLEAVKDPVNGYIPPEFIPDEIQVNKKGVVVGTDSDAESDTENRDDSDGSNINQSNNTDASGVGGTDTSASESSSKQTESDKAFNAKLKENPSSTKNKGKISASDLNVLELEPPGESS